jgi:hypothetical protein
MTELKMYYALIKFLIPQAGPTTVMAETREQAIERLTEMHKDCIGFEIIDIQEVSEDNILQQIRKMQDNPAPTVENKD